MKLFLYRVYQLVVMLPVLLVATVVTALCNIIGCSLGGGRWWGYYPSHLWGRLFCIMTLVKVKVSGRENIDEKTSYVFVANHQGAYDIFSIYGYLDHPFRWMMKASLRKIPLIGFACEKSGQIYVDKSSPSAIRRTMDRACQELSGGASLVVFPEGARTFTGKMRPFKRGAFTLAQDFGLPLVPVTIDGSFSVMPRTAKIPRWGHINITIHKPVAAPTSHEEQAEVMKHCFDEVESALPAAQRG